MTLYFSKELVEAVRFRTHYLKIVGSNSGALTISFFKDPIPVNRENKFHTFSNYNHISKVGFLLFQWNKYTYMCY